MREVLVVPTGTANTASVLAGLRRVGASPVLAEVPPEVVVEAPHVVVPGVGHFAAARSSLGPRAEALCTRIAEGRPTLAICVGMQLLAAGSEEAPGVAGLGVWPATVRRFTGVRVPQLGWNAVTGAGPVEDGYACFANSYALRDAPEGWDVAWADHGGPFVAAASRGAVLACQFHPELSGGWGVALLERWLSC